MHILARQVAVWPTTTGKVDAKWTTRYGAGTAAEAGNTDHYVVSARYSYQVEDKTLVGSHVRVWDMSFNSSAAAEADLKDYRVRSDVLVYYNPADPTQSYLSTAYPVGPVCLLLLGALIRGGMAIFSQHLRRFLEQWAVAREA